MNNAPTDVMLAGAFGLVGYWLIKHDFEPAPLLLGMVLGPLMEENLRRALLISRGDWTVFLTRPLSAVLMAICGGPAGAGGAAVAAQEARRGVRGVRELTLRRVRRILKSGGLRTRRCEMKCRPVERRH